MIFLKQLSFIFLILIAGISPVWGIDPGQEVPPVMPTEISVPPYAQETSPVPNSPEEPDRFYEEFIKMLLMLGMILVLLLFASWFFKRLMSSRVRQMNSTSLIKVLEKRALTAKSSVFLMEVLGKKILIADSQNGLIFLAHLDTPAEANNRGKFISEPTLE